MGLAGVLCSVCNNLRMDFSFADISNIKILGSSIGGRPSGKPPVDGDEDGFVSGVDGQDNIPAPHVPSISIPHNPGRVRKRRRDRLPVRDGRIRDRNLFDEEGFDRDPEENDVQFEQEIGRDLDRESRRNRLDSSGWFYDDEE